MIFHLKRTGRKSAREYFNNTFSMVIRPSGGGYPKNFRFFLKKVRLIAAAGYGLLCKINYHTCFPVQTQCSMHRIFDSRFQPPDTCLKKKYHSPSSFFLRGRIAMKQELIRQTPRTLLYTRRFAERNERVVFLLLSKSAYSCFRRISHHIAQHGVDDGIGDGAAD